MYKDMYSKKVVSERRKMWAEDRRADEMRRENLIETYYDLWKTKHPNAKKETITKQQDKLKETPTEDLSKVPRSGSMVLPWRETWFQYLRNRIITHPEDIDHGGISEVTGKHWSRSIQKHVRAFAADDFAKGLKSSFYLQKSGHVKKRQVHFRAKKQMVRYCLKVPKDSVRISSPNKIKVCSQSMKQWLTSQNVAESKVTDTIHLGRRQRSTKTSHQKRNCIRDQWRNPQNPAYFNYTPYITFDTRTREWHLVVTFDDTNQTQNPRRSTGSAVALDPGNRSFHAYYASNGEYGKVGDSGLNRLSRLAKLTQKLQSEIDQSKDCVKKKKPPPTYYRKGMKAPRNVNHRRRKHLHRKILRLNARIRELTRDIHCKFTKFLTERYDAIIRPPFETKDFLTSATCHATTKRGLNTWSHYKFRQRLQAKAKSKGVTLIEPSEAYTTKTCGLCGSINPNIGSKEIFQCVSETCYGHTHRVDRDIHAARNILLKAWCDPSLTNQNILRDVLPALAVV
jgi:transposase